MEKVTKLNQVYWLMTMQKWSKNGWYSILFTLKATSITKYLDTANQGKRQLFGDVELGRFVAAYLSRGILTQKTLEKNL